MKNIRDLKYTNNWFNYKEFYNMIANISHFKTFVEVGVWKGHSISYLAKLLENKDVKIYAVDLWEKSPMAMVPQYAKEVELSYKLYNMVLEDTQTRHLITDIKMDSSKAAEKFADKSIDFVFIDADHEYESVKNDIIAWLPKIKSGGIISGHDYHNGGPGIIKAVNELLDGFKLSHGTTWYLELK